MHWACSRKACTCATGSGPPTPPPPPSHSTPFASRQPQIALACCRPRQPRQPGGPHWARPRATTRACAAGRLLLPAHATPTPPTHTPAPPPAQGRCVPPVTWETCGASAPGRRRPASRRRCCPPAAAPAASAEPPPCNCEPGRDSRRGTCEQPGVPKSLGNCACGQSVRSGKGRDMRSGGRPPHPCSPGPCTVGDNAGIILSSSCRGRGPAVHAERNIFIPCK